MVDFDNIYNSYKENIEESFTSNAINKVKSTSQEDKRQIVTNIQFEDSEVELICHEHGVYTMNDARKVSSIENWFYNNDKIKSFDEFKYFTGLKKLENYAFNNCKSLQSINIPNSVTSIGLSAFCGCSSLQSIDIPNSVINIGATAFGWNMSLQSINIPNSVINIEYKAFVYCKSLQSINIPDSISYIGSYVFDSCTSLQSINISKDSPVYDEIKEEYPNIQLVDQSEMNESFTSNVIKKTKEASFEDKREKVVNIPFEDPEIERICHENGIYTYDDVKNIDEDSLNGLFEYNQKIVSFDEFKYFTNVKYLITGLFEGCRSLKSIILPSSLTGINYKSFQDCTKLENIIIPEGIKNIRPFAFRDCWSLSHIDLPSTVKLIDDRAFANCVNLKSIVIPDALETFGDLVFKNSIKTMYVSKKCKIYDQLYRYCEDYRIDLIDKDTNEKELEFLRESFTSKVIDKAKSTTIDQQRNEMFKIEFEDPEVEKICHMHGIYTIGDAKKVKTIMYRNSERDLCGWFKNNIDIKKFNEFKYFTGLEKLEFKAFYKCGFLTEITLPDSIKSIGNYAFESCSNLRKINIPDSVEKIEGRPFEHSGIIQYPGGKVIISKDNPLIEELKSVPHYRYMKFIDPSEVNESFTSNVIKKAKETTQEQKRQDVVQIQFEDPVVEKVCHEHGVYTIADAANVKSLRNGDDGLGWFFYKEKITKFNELKFFTSLEVISNTSFYHCKNLKEITLPENVKVLQEGSFTYCRNLTKININDKLEKISIGAFAECDSLKSIYLPTSIKIIGHNNLNNIEEIYVPSHCDFNEPQYKEFAELIIRSFDPSKIKNIIRINRDEYDEMMNESFTSNVINKAKSASIEDKRENVLHIQFEDSEVERICHDHGVYTINDAAKVTSILNWFTENEKIRRFEEFKYFTGLTSIDKLAFDACYFLYKITLPENINRIETSAFRDCISLKYIQLPDKVETIEDQAFKSDEELEYIGIGPNVKSIGNRCFAFCKNLKYIVLPDSLTQIGTTVFQRCNKLSQINIPDNALILEPQKLFDYRGEGFDYGKEHIDIIISKNHPNYSLLEFIYTSQESTFIDPSEINESFTSRVIDKAKSTSIDDKRKELFDYVDLGLPSGTLWCKHNYGVKEEYEYGERYSYDDAMVLETNIDRLPSKENFIELDENCTHEFISINGINGELFTSKINGQTIFFPAGGQEDSDHLYNLGRSGHYWASSTNKQNIGAYTLHFLGERINPSRFRRRRKKLSVRLVRYNDVNESFTSNVIKKTKEITQDDKRQIVSNINFEDPEIEHICHSNGVYTYADAANVKDGDNILSCFLNNEHIKKFNEFKYFTSLKYVPGYFFDGSPNIEEITLPESINVIEKGAFYGCNLKKIRIPNNVVSIRSNAFTYCDKLEEVEFDVDNSKLLLLEAGVFRNCLSIKSLHLPNRLQSIGKHSFAEMVELTELYIPNSLNHIIDARTLFFDFGCVRNNQKPINIHISKKCLAYNELYDSFKDCPGVNFIIEDEVNESFTSNVIKKTKDTTIEDKRSIVSKYIDLGLPSGNLWYTCNVGANNEEEVGDRFSYKEALSIGSLSVNDTKLVPNDQDFQELISNTNHNVEKVNGVIGMRLTSTINGRSIFFPATGTLHQTGELYDDDLFGGYRSSSEMKQGLSHCMMFNIVKNTIIASGQAWGSDKFPVRLVQKNNLKESFTSDVIKKHKNEDNVKKEIKEELIPEIKEFIYYNIAHELKKYDIEIKDLKYTSKEIGVVFNIIYKEKLSDVDNEFFGELSNSDIHVTIIPVQTGDIEQQCDLYVRDKHAYYLAGKIFIGSYREILNGIVEELKTLVDNIKNNNLKESFTSKVIKDTKEKTQEDKRKDLFDDIVFDAQKLVNVLIDHSYTYTLNSSDLIDTDNKVFRIFIKMDDQDDDFLLKDLKDLTSYVCKNVKVIYIQYSSKENTFAKISLEHFNEIGDDELLDIMKDKIAFECDDRNFYTIMRVFNKNVVTQFGKILKD